MNVNQHNLLNKVNVKENKIILKVHKNVNLYIFIFYIKKQIKRIKIKSDSKSVHQLEKKL